MHKDQEGRTGGDLSMEQDQVAWGPSLCQVNIEEHLLWMEVEAGIRI